MPTEILCPSPQMLRRSLDLDDPMTEPERLRIEEHIASCEKGCKEVIETLVRSNTLAAGPEGTQIVEDSTAAAPERPTPFIPGYEILDELGRGGMGVVYKARHVGLNRLVALKMILAGAHAAVEDLARFRIEAEAVASLQHTNVVQIYEIGEQDGRPYFSLEFVESGNLAQKLAGAPQPPRQAAGLIETLAWAVEFAHQRGIVHRDLKPANVLLTADGLPKITDFGLAKRLEGSAVQTRTGAVMGTPSYMAPEQGGGGGRNIGPATDVYALGAILYECLTGRPPFRGPTEVDTLMQMLHDEPASPRRLQSKTPPDLETICLKCLAKNPAQRYASAAALADDLRRFQADQPIRARPAAWPERLLKWVKRRPAVAALTAAVAFAVLVGLATSLTLAAWAFHERDQATDRLMDAQKADGRRIQAQIEQLGGAAPEAVPNVLTALKGDPRSVLPRLREIWADESGDRRRRMRAGLALLDDDPSLRDALADWMIEVEEPRKVVLVREVLAPGGAELTERLWSKANDQKLEPDLRFRALVGLAAFDPANPRWGQAAGMAADQLLKANPLHLGVWLAALRPAREWMYAPLAEVFRGRNPALSVRRLTATTILADYAGDQPAELADLACDADAEQCKELQTPLDKNRQKVLAALTAELAREAPAQEPEAARMVRAKRQGNAAAILTALGRPDPAWPILQHSRTPDARTVLIHALASHDADARLLIDRLGVERNPSSRAALILALGEFTAKQLPAEARATLTPRLLDMYRDDPDPGVHGAIDWLLRQAKDGPLDRPLDWGGRKALEKIDRELAGKPGPPGQRWYLNGQGQTFATVPGPVEFLMGSPKDEVGRGDDENLHRATIGRSFAVAARPVTVAQWEKFMEAMKKARLAVGHSYSKQYAPEPDCPIINVTWYEAAMYCRWLSEMEQTANEQMVYPPIEEILKCAEGQMPLKLPKDHLSRTGYRLPTEAEFEYACRADTATRWSCGEMEEYLPRYAWFLNGENRTWPAGQKKPNELGLFDVHGNVWTWCQEGYRPFGAAARADKEDNRDIRGGISRVLRGGSFYSYARDLRSASCRKYEPTTRRENDGFRPARTLPPDHFAALSGK